MVLPRKVEGALETELADVEAPDYVWIAYVVCAETAEACGWGGWMIEAAFKETAEQHPTATGDRLLSAVDTQVCPQCGGVTFRTGATLRMAPSSDQKVPLEPAVDCATEPFEYED